MKSGLLRKLVMFALIGTLFLTTCGCNEEMKYHPIYEAALIGGVIGTIVGHQHDKDCTGAAVGASVAALGCFLEQYDKLAGAEDIVIEVAGEDGAVIPVVLKKKDGIYYCPNGECYSTIPSRQELRMVFGI